MRFGVPQVESEDDDEEYTSYASQEYSSSEYDSDASIRSRSPPLPGLGQKIRACLDSSSEEESESDEDFELVGEEASFLSVTKSKNSWREVKAEISRSRRSLPVAESSKAPWRRAKMAATVAGLVPRDTLSPYEGWLRASEEEAMRNGHRLANERRGQLNALQNSAREQIRLREQTRQAQEEEDMTRLLESMAIRQQQDEEELSKKFAEREKQLWADIDAAIKEVEKQESERIAAEQEAERRKREEETARVQKAEREAKVKREEAERVERERKENEVRSREEAARAQEEEARRGAEEAARAEEADKARRAKGRTETEWKTWADKQAWMKTEVIATVKADRQTKMALKAGMRLITRGLGQVVNTKETIIRVAGELHNIFCQQLPSPPDADHPTQLDTAPKPYLYLLSHTSKALIKQAESEVSATSAAAFPLGRVVMLLLLHGHAAFGEILFARLNKKCPWVIPYYPVRQTNQPREEFEKSTGRGSDESVQDYIARMNGILALYFAIIQTPLTSIVPLLPYQPTKEHLVALVTPPLRFTAAWTWLAQAMRDPLPRAPPIATMVRTWVEILGAEAVRVFGKKQVMKMFEVIYREGVETGKVEGDSESARQQLGMVLSSSESLSHPTARDWEV